MKKLFLLFLLASLNSFSQNAVIVKKNGEKITADDASMDVIIRDKRVSYKLPGKTWEKYVTFKDLDYAQFGNYIFKSIKIDGKQGAYFVLAQDPQKTLVGLAVTYTYTSGNMSSSHTEYDIYILDNYNKVIDSVSFNDLKNKKNSNLRSQLGDKIRAGFPNCKGLISRLAQFEDASDERNFSVLAFMADPYFQKCN